MTHYGNFPPAGTSGDFDWERDMVATVDRDGNTVFRPRAAVLAEEQAVMDKLLGLNEHEKRRIRIARQRERVRRQHKAENDKWF